MARWCAFRALLLQVMSYSTLDRYGGIKTVYASARERGPSGSTGPTWWPDFGPSTHDFSSQPRSHPSEHIFDHVMQPKKWSTAPKSAPNLGPPVATQMRDPDPARNALFNKTVPSVDVKLAAHAVTERQASLRRLEMRQRAVDSWVQDAPVRMTMASLSDASRRSRSESALQDVSMSSSAASQVSRDVYEKHGYLVGRSKGNIADGMSGGSQRRHNPLSYNSMMFTGSLLGDPNGRAKTRSGPKKASGQWKTCPDSSYVLDPRTCLPVPRGGWASQPPDKWPEPPSNGSREFSASVGSGALMLPAPSP